MIIFYNRILCVCPSSCLSRPSTPPENALLHYIYIYQTDAVATCENVANRNALLGLPPGFRIGDWMCPGCGIHKFAFRNSCEKCDTPRPVDADGNTIAQAPRIVPPGAGASGSSAASTSTGTTGTGTGTAGTARDWSELLEEACELASRLPNIPMRFEIDAISNKHYLSPVDLVAVNAALSPIHDRVRQAFTQDPAQTLIQLERECNVYGNGLDSMVVEALHWEQLSDIGVQLAAECEAAASAARTAGTIIELTPSAVAAVIPDSSLSSSSSSSSGKDVPTRSPLLCFKVVTEEEKESALVAVNLSMPSTTLGSALLSDRDYFYITIGQITP